MQNAAGFHHEKLNGSGYPFHLDRTQLDLGAKIMGVADIFSAITEVRPYREGMKKEQAIKVLIENVERDAISGEIVKLLIDNYDEIDAVRERVSQDEGKRYLDSFKSEGERKLQ